MSRNTAYLSNIYLFRLTQFYSGHLDVVNYFFPIRLNVLIVMGLGLAGGWLFWEVQSPTFGEAPKSKRAHCSTFVEGPKNLSFYNCCTISRSVKAQDPAFSEGLKPNYQSPGLYFQGPTHTMYEQKYEPFQLFYFRLHLASKQQCNHFYAFYSQKILLSNIKCCTFAIFAADGV